MTAKEWADLVVKARDQYTYGPGLSEEARWKEKVAYSAGCIFALTQAGVLEATEICNELAHRCGDL